MPFSTAAESPRAWLHMENSGSHCDVCVWIRTLVCVFVSVHDDKDSPVCLVLLRHFKLNPDYPHLHTDTHTHTFTIATQTTAVSRRGDCWELSLCVLIEVLGHDALTAFPQPSLNLVTSVALLWLSPQWLLPVKPARLPRTQRRLRQPLTSEAATKRPETSRVGSSVTGQRLGSIQFG